MFVLTCGPLLFGQFLDRILALLVGGVVDENAELAEIIDRRLDSFSARIRIARFHRHHQPATAFAFDRLFRFPRIAFLLFEISERDIGAFAREKHRHRAANAGIAPSYQRYFAGEFVSAFVIWRFITRTWVTFDSSPGFS